MESQWETVTWDKRGRRQPGESKAAVVNQAMRAGSLESERALLAGTNKSAHFNAGGKSMRKIDDETEDFHHERVDRSLALSIQQARTAKGMTQKQLAMMIAEKPSVINDYESGKAIPNPAIISKLERILGAQLRQKKKKPAAAKPASAKK